MNEWMNEYTNEYNNWMKTELGVDGWMYRFLDHVANVFLSNIKKELFFF